jgi:hypothetical protein
MQMGCRHFVFVLLLFFLFFTAKLSHVYPYQNLQLVTAAKKGRVDEIVELMGRGADKERKDQVRLARVLPFRV